MEEKKIEGREVPAPPTEISIRTMESDLKSMSLSGGSSPLPKYVAMSAKPRIASKVQQSTSGALKPFFFILLFVLVVSGLVAIGYYLIYPALSKIFGQ